MTEEYFKTKQAELIAKHRAIMNEINSHPEYEFSEWEKLIDQSLAICNELAKLDTEYKNFILDQIEKGSLDAIQIAINKLFGVKG